MSKFIKKNSFFLIVFLFINRSFSAELDSLCIIQLDSVDIFSKYSMYTPQLLFFDINDSYISYIDSNGRISTYDLINKKKIKNKIKQFSLNKISQFSFVYDSNKLAFSSYDGSIYEYNIKTNKIFKRLITGNYINSFSYSLDESKLFVGVSFYSDTTNRNGAIFKFSLLKSKNEIKKYKSKTIFEIIHQDSFSFKNLKLIEKDNYISSMTFDNRFYVYDLKNKTSNYFNYFEKYLVDYNLVQGDTVILLYTDGTMILGNLPSINTKNSIKLFINKVNPKIICYCKSKNLYAIYCNDTISIFSIDRNEIRISKELKVNPNIKQMKWSPSGNYLVYY